MPVLHMTLHVGLECFVRGQFVSAEVKWKL